MKKPVKIRVDASTRDDLRSLKELSPEFIERMDYIVELLGFGCREELARCAIRRYVDRYFIIANSGLSIRGAEG